MVNKCGNCGKDCGDYKFCGRCNERYNQEQLRAKLVKALENMNQNLGHMVALYAEEHPESEKKVKAEWEKKKEDNEQEEEEQED